jgi:RNA polymerase sigma factor (sigma-70 family)
VVVTQSAPPDGDLERYWRSVLRTYERRLVAYVRSFERDPAEVADLVQATWCIAWERSRLADAGPVDLPFVLSCCREAARLRQAAYRHRTAVTRALEREPSFDADAIDETEVDALGDRAWNCLLTLPPRQRETVVWHLLYDRSDAETARLLGCAVGTMKAHYHRALLKLRRFASMLRG